MPVPAEERDRILRLVEAGQVSAAEAARLLDALASPAETAPPLRARARQRLVHIRVTDLLLNRPRTSVTIPVELIEVGLRLATRLAPQISGSALEQLLHAIAQASTGRLLDFQDLEENERVEIFLEER
ncbi:SHOCT-like domain-containing protein [Thermogemmatispora tikiterensis]|uniref:YvlB/LiaX N-terminal domain-containing protein n=1 Tax=Thermogemmatispora tikiterensis TaxID=1825093 RepID=A0A328VS13_9CHLR|nr:hypothetical protein [Thermogemmatispora tikiterensis]RAQ98024.1 hypothetical protein A4R35_20965 [Thermogemmatispora tikiterensis]